MNLPNRLTIWRMVLAVFFVVSLLLPDAGVVRSMFPYTKTVALMIFILASLTDWWDGWLARQQQLETNFGMLMDPLADKVLTTAAFICFIQQKSHHGYALVQAWMVLIIVARDFLVTGLRLVASGQGLVLKAERFGKQKTISQMVTIIVVLVGLTVRDDWGCFGFNAAWFSCFFSVAVFWLMVLTVSLTFFSGVMYFIKNRQVFLRDA